MRQRITRDRAFCKKHMSTAGECLDGVADKESTKHNALAMRLHNLIRKTMCNMNEGSATSTHTKQSNGLIMIASELVHRKTIQEDAHAILAEQKHTKHVAQHLHIRAECICLFVVGRAKKAQIMGTMVENKQRGES